MSTSKIAAQLYTVRQFTKTPEDIASTLKKVRGLGYEAVQLSALGPIETKELKKMLDGEGLTAAATHIGWDRLINQLDGVIEEHQILECKNVAVGGLPKDLRNAEGYKTFVKQASEVAQKLQEAGFTFSYHNHAFEFERYGERTAFQTLVEDSDKALGFEIDTYWVQYGGGDPAYWIRQVKGRIPIVHLKDMTIKDNAIIMAEVGEGNLNWGAILEACNEAGVEWYCIEQDICQRDPFESLGISFNNLKAMMAQ